MSIRNFFGLAVILITVSGILGFGYLQGQNKELVSGDLATESQSQAESVPVEELTSVEGYLGWEKKRFFQDEEVQAILADEYGLDVGISKKGSIEMVTEPTNGQDYLFPSNRIATELYRSRTGTGSETVFFSPIVVYTWDSLVDDLQTAGLVEVRDGIHYIDTNKLVTSIEAGTTWQEAGGRQLQGPIKVHSTNPVKSSSGNLFSALVFSAMTEQYPPSTSNVTPETTERLQEFFRNMGLLESSSSDLFEKFLTLGRSSYPLTVGYESQLIELLNAETPGADQIVPLYPEPTVWAEHGFIALNDEGQALEEALINNERLGEIAWEKYGLRRIGQSTGIARYESNGIAPELGQVSDLPKVEVMEAITAGL